MALLIQPMPGVNNSRTSTWPMHLGDTSPHLDREPESLSSARGSKLAWRFAGQDEEPSDEGATQYAHDDYDQQEDGEADRQSFYDSDDSDVEQRGSQEKFWAAGGGRLGGGAGISILRAHRRLEDTLAEMTALEEATQTARSLYPARAGTVSNQKGTHVYIPMAPKGGVARPGSAPIRGRRGAGGAQSSSGGAGSHAGATPRITAPAPASAAWGAHAPAGWSLTAEVLARNSTDACEAHKRSMTVDVLPPTLFFGFGHEQSSDDDFALNDREAQRRSMTADVLPPMLFSNFGFGGDEKKSDDFSDRFDSEARASSTEEELPVSDAAAAAEAAARSEAPSPRPDSPLSPVLPAGRRPRADSRPKQRAKYASGPMLEVAAEEAPAPQPKCPHSPVLPSGPRPRGNSRVNRAKYLSGPILEVVTEEAEENVDRTLFMSSPAALFAEEEACGAESSRAPVPPSRPRAMRPSPAALAALRLEVIIVKVKTAPRSGVSVGLLQSDHVSLEDGVENRSGGLQLPSPRLLR
mmetsp:Transcript_86824/g.278532  ORF Transcript_86824/g.278532 Transcript_86824/m.278532 type:complete len:523 (-) Transcript_86824:188-1756(-)